MTKQEIIDYVMNTPANTNPNVLSGMLDSIANAGGGTLRVNITSFNPTDGSVYDKTWQEVHDALESGMDVTYQHSGNMYLRILNATSAPDGSAYGIIAENLSCASGSTTAAFVLDSTFFTQLTSPDDYLKVGSIINSGGGSDINPPIVPVQ